MNIHRLQGLPSRVHRIFQPLRGYLQGLGRRFGGRHGHGAASAPLLLAGLLLGLLAGLSEARTSAASPDLGGMAAAARAQDRSFHTSAASQDTVSAQSQVEMPGRSAVQTFIPVLGRSGDAPCANQLQLQNMGAQTSKAVLLLWGEPGECGAQAAGPERVLCTGLIAPGTSWLVPPADLGERVYSAVIYSFSAESASEAGLAGGFPPDDPVADILCELMFFELPTKADAYAAFKRAFDTGASWSGIQLDRTYGSSLAVSLIRECGDPAMSRSKSPADVQAMGLPADRLGAVDGASWTYRLPLDSVQGRVYLQNADVDCVQVEFGVLDANCSTAPTLRPCLGPQSLAPGEHFEFTRSACGGHVVGMASLLVTATGPLAIVVDSAPESGGRAGWSVIEAPGSELRAPLVFEADSTWQVSAIVQNHDGAREARVKLYILDRSGDVVTTLSETICPGNMARINLPRPPELDPFTGSLQLTSLSAIGGNGQPVPGAAMSAQLELRRSQGGAIEAVQYAFVADEPNSQQHVDQGLIALPRVRKLAAAPATRLAIQNTVGKPGFTDSIVYIFDANGLLDFVCQKLHDRQVEYIDLANWGYVNTGFQGSFVVSASFWEHFVYDAQGNKIGNPVSLNAVAGQRAPLGLDPGREAVAVTGLRFAPGSTDWADLGLPICGGGPVLPPTPGPGTPSITPRPGTPLPGTPSPTPGPGTASATAGPGTPSPARPSPTPDIATPSPTAPRPSRVYLPLILRDAESWPTGFILLVETSPDAPIPLARPIPSFELDGSSGDLAAARRIGSLALGSLRAQRDAVAILRYDRSAELVLLTHDPAEAIAALESLAAVGPRATTRPDLGLAAVLAAGLELRETMDRPDQALLIFIDGASSTEHLQRAIERAARLRAEGLAIFVVGQAMSGASEGLRSTFVDSLTAIAGRADRVAVWDPARPASLDAVLDRTRSWGARGWLTPPGYAPALLPSAFTLPPMISR